MIDQDDLDDLGMPALRDAGRDLDLTFPPGVTKDGAREQIREKLAERAAAEHDPANANTATEGEQPDGDGIDLKPEQVLEFGHAELTQAAAGLGIDVPPGLSDGELLALILQHMGVNVNAPDPDADKDRLPVTRRESTGEWRCPFPGCETRDSHESRELRCHCGAAVLGQDEDGGEVAVRVQ